MSSDHHIKSEDDCLLANPDRSYQEFINLFAQYKRAVYTTVVSMTLVENHQAINSQDWSEKFNLGVNSIDINQPG